MNINRKDWKYVPVDPDPEFNPKRNQELIDDIIRQTDVIAARKRQEFKDGLRERTEAATRYLEAVKLGNASDDVKSYFGKRQLAYLHGVEVMDKLRKHAQEKS